MANKQTGKAKEEGISLDGAITDSIKGGFIILIDNPDPKAEKLYVTGYIAGNLRRNKIKLVCGDRVTVEVSPYDLKKGRITYRLKG